MAGSLEHRGGDKWRLVVSAGRDASGKRIKYTRVFHGGEREAKKALSLFVAEILRDEYVKPEKMTVADFLRNWLRDYAAANTAPSTYKRYVNLVENHAIPRLGAYKLDQIKPPHVVKMYNDMQKEGSRKDGKPGAISGTTVLQLHRILHKAFETGVRWNLFSKNIIDGVDAPRRNNHEITPLTEEQVKQMLELVSKEAPHYHLITLIAVIGGLRRSEILGLRWRDTDFSKNAVMVNQTLHYVKGWGLFFKEPKNRKSRRAVTLPAELMGLLKQYKAAQNERRLALGDLWQDNDLVFTGWNGKPFHPDNVTSWFKDFMRRSGLPPVNFHTLRHTSCSLLISEGLHAKVISSRLGHSGIQITMNTYGHLFEASQREAADALAHLVTPSISTASNKQSKRARG